MNDKIYFKTHLDLNRYAALLRVLMYKLAKYLARKRFAMMRAAINKWRGGLSTFLETDISSSHINDIAIDYETSDPGAQFGSIEHQKNILTDQHLRLKAIAEEVVITSPDRQYPRSYVDEYGHDNVLSMPLRVPDAPQLDRNSELSQQIEEWSLERSAKMALKASEKLSKLAANALSIENSSPSRDADQSTGMELSRYSASRDSERGDSRSDGDALGSFSRPMSPGLGALVEVLPSGEMTPFEEPLAIQDAPPPDHTLVPSYFPSQGVDLPPLPTIFIPRTAQERLFLKNERRLDYASYRESMIGPTFDSNWVIPNRLSMGCMPWGPAETSNTEYPVEALPQLNMSVKSTKSTKSPGMGLNTKNSATEEITPGAKALNASTNASSAEIAAKAKFKTNKWKPPPVTAVSALLLNRVDYFVSLMDEDEEEAIEFACKVPSVETCIRNALATANAAVMTIISQCMAVISKQTKQLDDIPRYGKSDPRYPAATREILRCKARIQLANDNMHRAKQQIKNLPPRADFIRIPLRLDGLVTPNQMLPKIWQLEELLQQGRTLYIYSRDGHGRAGLVAGIMLGRLYNLHPYEALYRIQACHDSAKRESERAIPINCPQLPVQRELLAQILHLTNRPQEMTFIRTQIDPDTFVEHMPQRALLYDTSTSSHASVNGSYLPTQSFLNGVSGGNKVKKKRTLLASSFGSFNDSVSVVTALTPRTGASDGFDSPIGGSSAPSTAPSTARTGKVSLLKSISWRSIQLEQEQAALEVAAKARDEELGNNHEVIEAENEFLQALYAAQNIRKKQTMVMKQDAPFTWSRGSGITHRGDNVPPTHTSAHHTTMPPEPLLPDLYTTTMLGQSVDVARKLPTRRPEPTERPHLPQIRSALTPQP